MIPDGHGDADRTFIHFTDEDGVRGIANIDPPAPGQTAAVSQLSFARGANPHIIGSGRIGVTDLDMDATSAQLDRIGVFGNRQRYAIKFTWTDAYDSGVRVEGTAASQHIYSIPGPCTISGTCSVTRVR